jgi:hypothetical protein
MKKYYVYHIPGVKIGCSVNPKNRVYRQGYTDFEILEEHTDIDIASEREIELQIEYGYIPDCTLYSQTVECGKVGRLINPNFRLQGKRNVENGWIKEFQQRSVIARTGTRHSEETKLKIKLKAIGRKSNKRIPILVFDKSNNIIGTYDSILHASNELNLQSGNVSNALNGKLKTTGGYIIKKKI